MTFSSLQRALDSSAVVIAADSCISEAVGTPNYKIVGRLESCFAKDLNVTASRSDTSRNKCSSASQALLNRKQYEARQKEIEEEEDISLIRKAASAALRQQQKKIENHNNSANTSHQLSCILETMHSGDINGGNREQSQQKQDTAVSLTPSSYSRTKTSGKSVPKKKKFNCKHNKK
jgi:hypothetical protein